MVYHLTRTAGVLAKVSFAKARAGTISAKLINLPARIASSTRRLDGWCFSTDLEVQALDTP